MYQDKVTPRTVSSAGFTLIELSIVLVIIGLIVGAIVVGRDMIAASEIRATITQITSYQTAMRTFQTKYGFLPGDIPDPTATSFGFGARGTHAGQGDGNGILEGSGCNTGCNYGNHEAAGETVMFWEDLSQAGLIAGNFTSAVSIGPVGPIPASSFPLYFPTTRLNPNTYVLVGSGGVSSDGSYLPGVNYFTIQGIVSMTASGSMSNSLPVTPIQAYNIDVKIDDGSPFTGTVKAAYALTSWDNYVPGAAGGLNPASCYDNINNAANPTQYNFTYGNNQNCSVAVQF